MKPLTEQDILHWLREDAPARLQELWDEADRVRRAHVGDAIHLRGLVEVSNYCVRECAYCGIRNGAALERYRMEADEVLACARQAAAFGYGTLVLQAGEDYGITREWLAELVRRIKDETSLAITLSMGERPYEDLYSWHEAGADRYLLRFETSDPTLFAAIHPGRGGRPSRPEDRLKLLFLLRELGYETGSGVMVGIPGQSYESLAHDIALFGENDLDMIGLGPYVPHPQTPMGRGKVLAALPEGGQVPGSEEMVLKALALARLVCPEANIPSTTALAALYQQEGRELGLRRGANVVMPNLTPPCYRKLYEIYPHKACFHETAEAFNEYLHERITALGRTFGQGQGGRWHS